MDRIEPVVITWNNAREQRTVVEQFTRAVDAGCPFHVVGDVSHGVSGADRRLIHYAAGALRAPASSHRDGYWRGDSDRVGSQESVMRWMTRVRRQYEPRDITVETTSKGHTKLTHPNWKGPAFSSGSPSDWRSSRNLAAEVKRHQQAAIKTR